MLDTRWLDFKMFYADMGDPPKGKSLDRIDNNGPYSKLNCKWSDPKTQARNRRNTFYCNFNGRREPLAILCERFERNYDTIYYRITRYGYSIEQALWK